MEFVTFHIDRPTHSKSPHPNVELESQIYMRMIDLLFRSVRLFHPEASCTLLTDARTHVSGIRGAYQRVNSIIDYAELMLHRSLAQVAYVEANSFRSPMVLVDSDILFNRSLAPLLNDNFDVALTWRENTEMPINGGLIILNNRHPAAVRDFLLRYIALYRSRYADSSAWYGDQLALRDCVGLNYREMAARREMTVDGCRILFLPCDIFNYSPPNRSAAILDGLKEKTVVHFKGQRKRLIQPFWDAHLRPKEAGLPLLWLPGYLARLRLRTAAKREAKTGTTMPEIDA